MQPLNLNDVVRFVEENIGDFHQRRADNLRELKLYEILKKKNPYLFKAKNVGTSEELVKLVLDAHLSSQEETIFGEFLESVAIFVCNKVFGGKKSAAEGIDLEFEQDGILYIISVKSGPNWGNSGQVKRMRDDFKKAQRILRTGNPNKNIVAINGCCYGRLTKTDKGDYRKFCGQEFWEFISGNDRLYIEIVEPLGHQAKIRNDEFIQEYKRILNMFSHDFYQDFCSNGFIDWGKLVEFNSGKAKRQSKRKSK